MPDIGGQIRAAPRRRRLKKVKGQRVFEQVSDQLRAELDQGTLKTGDKLPSERDLAARFGVSRSAVREALRTLEMSGVLQFSKGVAGGAFIREGSTDGVKQSIRDMVVIGSIPLGHLTEVRACLLGLAARLAAERGTTADFTLLRENIDLTETLLTHDNPVDSIAAINEFYMLLGRASHNLIMPMMVDSLTEIVRDLLMKIRLRPTLDMITPRRRVLAFLMAGDGAAAEREIREHLIVLTQFIAERTDIPI